MSPTHFAFERALQLPHARVRRSIMLHFCVCWHFTAKKALSCHSNWFIWVAIYCQMPDTLFKWGTVSPENNDGQLFSVTVSLKFFSILKLTAHTFFFITIKFTTPASSQLLQTALQPTSLQGKLCSLISLVSISKLVLVLWLTLLMGLCVQLLAWKLLYCLCFAVYLGGLMGLRKLYI